MSERADTRRRIAAQRPELPQEVSGTAFAIGPGNGHDASRLRASQNTRDHSQIMAGGQGRNAGRFDASRKICTLRQQQGGGALCQACG